MKNRKKSPLISVIIPTYNSKVYLKRAVKSVLNQTYKNLEIYVIDDGSIDQTRTLMKQLISKDKRINYVKIKHSGLPSVARNAGLKKAKGNYIALLDHDDYWFSDKLRKQLTFFLKDKRIDILCSNAHINNKKRLLNLHTNQFFTLSGLLNVNNVITSSVIFNSDIIKTVGVFNEQSNLGYEDYEFWLRCLIKKREICYLSKTLLYYTDNPHGITKMLRKEDNDKKLLVFKSILNNTSLNLIDRQMIMQKIWLLRKIIFKNKVKEKLINLIGKKIL